MPILFVLPLWSIYWQRKFSIRRSSNPSLFIVSNIFDSDRIPTCLFTMNNTTGKQEQELKTLLEIMFSFISLCFSIWQAFIFCAKYGSLLFFFVMVLKYSFPIPSWILSKICIPLRYYFIIKFKPQSYILWLNLFWRVTTFVDSWKCVFVNIWFRYYAKVCI